MAALREDEFQAFCIVMNDRLETLLLLLCSATKQRKYLNHIRIATFCSEMRLWAPERHILSASNIAAVLQGISQLASLLLAGSSFAFTKFKAKYLRKHAIYSH